MPSTETRKQILDAAELLFAEKGYAGASIRCITAAAGVDLGAVRYHFGNKDGLFGEVMKRRLEPLNQARLARLDALESRSGPKPPTVEEISEAFLMPAIDLILDPVHGEAWRMLIGRVRVEPGDYLDSIQETYLNLLNRFLEALGRALPELPRKEVAYRFYFLFGAEVNTLIDDGTLGAMGEGLPDLREDSEGVCRRLIEFVSAGMKAPGPVVKKNPFGEPPRPPRSEEPATRTRVG